MFGFLMGAAGGGALGGAIFLALRKTVVGLVRMVPLMTGLFSFGLISFALSCYQGLSMFILLFAGFGMMVQTAASNTILQTIVVDDKRGRVMSFYVMCLMGTTHRSGVCWPEPWRPGWGHRKPSLSEGLAA